MTIAERLKEARVKAGLSQEQVAEKLHVSRQLISRWESGVSEPKASELLSCANVFQTTIAYLYDTAVPEPDKGALQPEDQQVEVPQPEGQQAEVSQPEDQQAEESQSEDQQAEGSQSEDQQAEESQSEDQQAEESQSKGQQAEESQLKGQQPVVSRPEDQQLDEPQIQTDESNNVQNARMLRANGKYIPALLIGVFLALSFMIGLCIGGVHQQDSTHSDARTPFEQEVRPIIDQDEMDFFIVSAENVQNPEFIVVGEK